MFLEGYRDKTESEKAELVEKFETLAYELSLVDKAREEYLEAQMSSLEAEKVYVVPVENVVRKI